MNSFQPHDLKPVLWYMESMLIDHLPDVSQPQKSVDWGIPLSRVGMSQVELPVSIHGLQVPAQVDFYVNLNSREARGIHMSRLYSLLVDKLSGGNFSIPLLSEIAGLGLQSHADLSTCAQVSVRLNLPLQRSSLKSGLAGWRAYPIDFKVERTSKTVRSWLTVSVLYSSTCPASAALAYQIHAESSLESGGFAATPHAQRSSAKVTVELDPSQDFNSETLIDLLEGALGTPVQTLVKRQDEQQFAILNAQNLMFCEDAARRLAKALDFTGWALDYRGEVHHMESLHPHNASAYFSKTDSKSP